MKILSLIPILLLVGCTTTGVAPVVTKDVPFVISPPDTLYNCPVVEELPDPDTLTNKDIAVLIVTLDKNNHICKTNIDAIHDYVEKLKKEVAKD